MRTGISSPRHERDKDGRWWVVWVDRITGDETARGNPDASQRENLEDAYHQGRRSVEERREADVAGVAGVLVRALDFYDGDIESLLSYGLGNLFWQQVASEIVATYRAPLPSWERLTEIVHEARPPEQRHEDCGDIARAILEVLREG